MKMPICAECYAGVTSFATPETRNPATRQPNSAARFVDANRAAYMDSLSPKRLAEGDQVVAVRVFQGTHIRRGRPQCLERLFERR